MNEDTFNNDGIIAAIREYENSVEMPEDERMTCLDANNHVHLKAGDDKAPDYAQHAEKCREYLRFGDEVDLATCGGMNPLNQIKVCDTPQLLIEAGFKQKPMLYTQRHLLDALHPKDGENYHWHGLDVTKVKRLPYLLENPVLLSDSPSRKDALLAVLAEVDGDRLPLIVAIKPDGKGNYELQEIETNFILSVYGKDDFSKYFSERITPERTIYFNEKQGRKLEALAELQLFRCHPVAHDLENTIVHQPECIVNSKTVGQNEYNVRSEAKAARDSSVSESEDQSEEKVYNHRKEIAMSYEVYEDNGGGLHLAVLEDGKCVYLASGYEQTPGSLRRDIVELEGGADPVADDWDSRYDSDEMVNECYEWLYDASAGSGAKLIADNDGVYYGDFGGAACEEWGIDYDRAAELAAQQEHSPISLTKEARDMRAASAHLGGDDGAIAPVPVR